MCAYIWHGLYKMTPSLEPSVSSAVFAWRVVVATILTVVVHMVVLMAFGRIGQYIATPDRVYGTDLEPGVDMVDESLDVAELRQYQPDGNRSVFTGSGSIDTVKLRVTLVGATRYRCPVGYLMRPLEGARWECTTA